MLLRVSLGGEKLGFGLFLLLIEEALDLLVFGGTSGEVFSLGREIHTTL